MEVVGELRYQKLEQIGIGEGMHSEVFRSLDLQIGGEIAVKEIPKASFGNKISRYFEEAQVMFAVAHPHVVSVRYGCTTPSHVVLGMPYYKKGSLAGRISINPLPLGQCLRVCQGVLTGLAQIHLARFLHLDIRPPNLLFDEMNEPLVADFGQARKIDSSGVVQQPDTYTRVMPPEILNKAVATVESDIYQVGLLVYRALNGEQYYRDQWKGISEPELFNRIDRGKFPDRNRFLPHIPKRLRTVVRKALSTSASDRYHSATEMADALARIDLDLDWSVHRTGANTTWSSYRKEAPNLIVELAFQDWNDRWAVSVFTESNGVRRAKAKNLYWRESLKSPDAEKHLKEIFTELK